MMVLGIIVASVLALFAIAVWRLDVSDFHV
jgi:hypothetical protein